jgi:hypothetical protein
MNTDVIRKKATYLSGSVSTSPAHVCTFEDFAKRPSEGLAIIELPVGEQSITVKWL